MPNSFTGKKLLIHLLLKKQMCKTIIYPTNNLFLVFYFETFHVFHTHCFELGLVIWKHLFSHNATMWWENSTDMVFLPNINAIFTFLQLPLQRSLQLVFKHESTSTKEQSPFSCPSRSAVSALHLKKLLPLKCEKFRSVILKTVSQSKCVNYIILRKPRRTFSGTVFSQTQRQKAHSSSSHWCWWLA